MDKLKNFIDMNREAFEDDLLPEGHLGRFEQKLAAPRKSRATLHIFCAFAAAACIALLLLSNYRAARLCIRNLDRRIPAR